MDAADEFTAQFTLFFFGVCECFVFISLVSARWHTSVHFGLFAYFVVWTLVTMLPRLLLFFLAASESVIVIFYNLSFAVVYLWQFLLQMLTGRNCIDSNEERQTVTCVGFRSPNDLSTRYKFREMQTMCWYWNGCLFWLILLYLSKFFLCCLNKFTRYCTIS